MKTLSPIGEISHQFRCQAQLGRYRSRLDGCHRKKLPRWWLLHQDLLVKHKESQINKLWFDGKIETQQLMESNEDETAGI